jgi:hypothetical protein
VKKDIFYKPIPCLLPSEIPDHEVYRLRIDLISNLKRRNATENNVTRLTGGGAYGGTDT